MAGKARWILTSVLLALAAAACTGPATTISKPTIAETRATSGSAYSAAFEEAVRAMEAGQWRRSNAILGELLFEYQGEDEVRGALYALRAKNFIELGEYEAALADANQAAVLHPDEGAIWYVRGQAFYHLERYGDAVRNLSASIRRNGDEWSYYWRGRAYIRLESWHAAIADMEFFASAQPDLVDGWLHLGLLYALTGRNNLGISALARAAEIEPDNPDVRRAMANLNCSYERYRARRCG